MSKSAAKNKVKPDTILKNFWKDNQRFADLFNTVLFNSDPVLKPSDLKEVDTDVSSIIKFNGHIETVQRILDVVRKTAFGVDFIIWGLENQKKIHYAMPLRHMLADALIYLKEYNEIAARNKKEKSYNTSDEFLSSLKKEDRLHPVISLCIYYGEKDWDGPFDLLDMMIVPDNLKFIISNYKMNLIEVRKSENLLFENEDIDIVFKMVRSIYNDDYNGFYKAYKDQSVSVEVGLTVGSIVNSQAIINQALSMEKEGGNINMCEALQRWLDEEVKKGKIEGKVEGKAEGKIEGTINTYRRFHVSKKETKENLIKEFLLSEIEAEEYMNKFWD